MIVQPNKVQKMEFLNRIELRGVVGRSDLSTVGQAQKCRFSIVTEYGAYRNGESVVESTWFNVNVWEGRGMPDLSKIQPGCWVWLVGRIRTYKYTTPDGEERSSWEITASRVDILPREEGERMQPNHSY